MHVLVPPTMPWSLQGQQRPGGDVMQMAPLAVQALAVVALQTAEQAPAQGAALRVWRRLAERRLM